MRALGTRLLRGERQAIYCPWHCISDKLLLWNPQVAAIDSVKKVLDKWDISQTDVLIEKIEKEQAKKAEEEKKRLEAECNRLTVMCQLN